MSLKVEDITTEGWDTIHKAAFCGDYNVILDELNSGVSPNHISNNFKSKCKRIFSKDKIVYFTNMTPLYITAQKGHLKCIKLLIDRGADPYISAKNLNFNVNCDAFSVSLSCNKLFFYILMKKIMKNKNKNITNYLASNNYEDILSSSSNNMNQSLIGS